MEKAFLPINQNPEFIKKTTSKLDYIRIFFKILHDENGHKQKIDNRENICNSIHAVIHCLLSTYYMPATLLSVWDTTVSKTEKELIALIY